MSVRVLAIADEVVESLYGETLHQLRPDVIVSAGDLPFEYLENLVSRAHVPLLFVPGNHDPDVKVRNAAGAGVSPYYDGAGPAGCDSIDGRMLEVAGLSFAGLGGSVRYKPGPNQYSQRRMRLRALGLELRTRLGRQKVDLLVTHSPPAGYGDSEDPPHHGFTALIRLVTNLAPKLLIHGHVNYYGPKRAELRIGQTLIVNVIPYKLLEI